MASTSASSIRKSFKYDVFLSFRGEDTRKSFVDHLYHALERKSIVTYKDDKEIKKGKKISDELIKSIEDSNFYIIVFSKNYASSSWCLDELVKIIECQKTNDHTAFPVFFDVEPAEVRKQNGAVGKAFAKHIKEEEEEVVEKWRKALREAAGLAGWELKNTFDGHESMFIEKIVEEISLGICYPSSSFGGKLVGMETRLKDVVSLLETTIDDARMIGITGIGGGGKTTLAKVVFDQISPLYEGSSFVENVRECSKESLWGLKSLQKQVLLDVTNGKEIIVNGVSDLTNVMKKIMSRRKVLVVLDDVDDTDQLEALAGELNWFKAGSRVIITTRDEQVLVAHGVPDDLILKVNLLSDEEANCLFNRHAFGRVIPNQGYEELTRQAISYAAGLPLTIQVLGSFLRRKSELVWVDALKRLKTIPLKKTLDVLELSYNSLEDEYKEIFLDVACMLKGWKKEEAIIALESRGFYARNGLNVLELKSLITVTDSERVGMHDHLAEMGQDIVRRSHRNEPCKHSRLWIQKEIEDILVNNKGTEATRCINMQMIIDPCVLEGLKKMTGLRFLNVKEPSDGSCVYHDSGEDSLYLPNGLQYLGWTSYPFKFLPEKFEANDLVGLKLYRSNMEQLWKVEEREVPNNIRFIDMYDCQFRSIDNRLIPNLEKASLVECYYRLVELHIPAQNSKLTHLNLQHNVGLRTLDLGQAHNLDELKVENCYKLIELRMPIVLKHLTIRMCSRLKTLDLRRTRNLETLNLGGLDSLDIHMPDESPKLKHLTLSCSKFKTLNLMRTQNLEMLNLECERVVELHIPTENVKMKSLTLRHLKLRTVNLTGYENLESLELDQFENLIELHMPESSKLKAIKICYSKLRTFNLTGSENLESLDLEQCEDLVELHMPESSKLKAIKIRFSKLRTLNLTGSENLESLDLEQCEEFVELHMPESSKLETIKICCSKLRTLNLARYENLESLHLEQCEDLVELHTPGSSKLKTIKIRRSKLKTLNLTRSENLKSLDLEQCKDLVELHMPESSKLKAIKIRCSKLGILNLTGCENVKSLDLEQCEDLVELDMPESSKIETIKIQCSKLATLRLGLSPYIKCLDLEDCFTMAEISAPIGCGSGRVSFKPVLFNPGYPSVGCLAELHLTAKSYLGICPLHPHNNLPKFHLVCVYKDLLPSLIGILTKHISSDVCPCTNLATSLLGSICGLQSLRKVALEGDIPEVPKETSQLECLEEVTLLSTKIEHLPDSICMMKHLKVLELKSCWFLKQLPEDIDRFECLEELHINDCTSLRDIPNSICKMKHLKCFRLINCILVKELPKELGRLKCLKELHVQGTGVIDLPQSIYELEDLTFFL